MPASTLDPSESDDMICACESQEFVPYGRQYYNQHPGRHAALSKLASHATDHGLPLVKALKDISITDKVKDSWKLRPSPEAENSNEELYVNENVVVWSRGSLDGASTTYKSFTVDSHVQEAHWCTFLLPMEMDPSSQSQENAENVAGVMQKGVCVVESSCVSFFSTDGKDYMTALLFPVAKSWPIMNGVLFERVISAPNRDVSKTPKKDQPSLPVLFSMLHPLDETAPVICRTGGISSSGKVSFVTENSQKIVFSSREPSLVMTYDRIVGVHSVWNVRRAKPDEAYNVVGMGSSAMDYCTSSSMPPLDMTPGVSGSQSLSRLTVSSQSPSLASPLRSFSSRVNSPSVSQSQHSRLNSPSFSRIATLSRSQSPSVAAGSLYRLNTPSPKVKSSPISLMRTPVSSQNTSLMDQSYMETEAPQPEVCLDHIWTESASIHRDGGLGEASKVFIYKDLCGQQYLCYMVAYRHQLRCVKFEESNDRSQLIFGALSCIPARDAAPLTTLNMILVLDMQGSLVLYSGIMQMNQVHVSGLPSPLVLSGSGGMGFTGRPSLAFDSPLRLSIGPVTSSRPPSAMDARFDEDVAQLSPVRTEPDTSQVLDSSLTEEISFHVPPTPVNTGITGLRDSVADKVTLELVDGSMYRTSLPSMTNSPLIDLCLEALKQILPKDIAMQVLVKWYCIHNAPGSLNGQSELTQFSKCLLNLMGYDVSKLPLTQQYDGDSSLSPELAPKKARHSDQGAGPDWDYLLSSDHHQLVNCTQGHVLGLENTASISTYTAADTPSVMDTTQPLFPHIPAVLFALHLVYEELKLDTLLLHDISQIAALLCQLASDLGCDLYTDHYCRDHAGLLKTVRNRHIPQETLEQLHLPSYLSKEPPSIYHWLYSYLRGFQTAPFPYLQNVSTKTRCAIVLYVSLLGEEEDLGESTWQKHLRRISAAGRRAPPSQVPINPNFGDLTCINRYQRAILCMVQLGLTVKDQLVFGVSLPLKEAIYRCRSNPPSDWPQQAFMLIGREDLAKQSKAVIPTNRVAPTKDTVLSSKGSKEEEDGMEYLDKDLLKLRFSEDLRVQEVRRLLQSSRPVKIALTQKPEVSDHEFIEEQERHLYAICIRTMALPMGRGMLTLNTYHPVPTETQPIPKLCLTGRAPPRNTAVDLTHIDTPTNMNTWPQFHNGVAAGLRIANSSQVDSTWIIYNKPRTSDLSNEHAGFLMGLGLNGHLNALNSLYQHDYLLKSHEMTSVGLLLGVAAGKRGTMDVATTRTLSIHLPALLPPTSTELPIPHIVQVAAVLGVGLVYQGTAHRHIAEVLLSEIGRPPGPEMENCADRESYSLAAGLALGMVMLAHGSKMVALSDLNMADQLYHYMVGGHKRPLTGANKERYKSPSYQIKEGDSVNVDVTAPGATLALGMMYFNTKNKAVVDWLAAPDTQFLLDFVRPDFLMLRVVARSLVLWDDIHPSKEWIDSNIPEIVNKYAFKKTKYRDDPDCDIDFETMSQAYCHIIAGACMAMALRFAGSANQPAFHCLMTRAKQSLELLSKPQVVEQAGRSNVENCLAVITLSLAMVMSGTGNLEVLRLCRHLRARVGPSYNYVLYGSHMAVSMAIGLLFLGGGRYTLSTTPESVAVMLCAFFPKFPIHSNDNRYHLQAFRHLYVLASEMRVLLPRDVDSGAPCYVPLHVKFKDTSAYKDKSYDCVAPCVLPELSLIKQIEVKGPRYWPIEFHADKNWKTLKHILKGTGYLYVKLRAGHLSYVEDPKGYHSVLSQSLTNDQSIGKMVKSEDIKSFSSDPRILAFAEYFCHSEQEEEYGVRQFLAKVLYECVSQEKPEVLATHIAMEQVVDALCSKAQPLGLWQIKLMEAYYHYACHRSLQDEPPEGTTQTLISRELLNTVDSKVQHWLHQWQTEHVDSIVCYLSGQQVAALDCGALASFLTWYNLPHPTQLAQIHCEGEPTFVELYSMLQPYGLSVSAVMSLLSVLQTKVS